MSQRTGHWMLVYPDFKIFSDGTHGIFYGAHGAFINLLFV